MFVGLYQPRSIDSFISEVSEHELHHSEDDQHVTEVERVDGRPPLQKRVDAILSRRISRSHSHNLLPPSKHMVIDVSVEKATVDSPHTHSDDIHTTIHAARSGLHSRASTLSTQATTSPAHGLVQRAKSFARKFGRRRKPIAR